MTAVESETGPDVTRRVPVVVLALIVPALAVVAVLLTQVFADDSNGAVAAAGSDAVEIENFEFSPDPLRAEAGARVAVTNLDGTVHTLTADAPESFDTGDLDGGAKATLVAPAEPGSYGYYCRIHNYMTGRLEVEG